MANEHYHSERRLITGRHLGWTILIVTSIVLGVATFFVQTVFLVGAVAVAVGIVVMFRYPYFGLLLYLVTFIIRPGELYPALDPLRLERVVGLGVLVAGLLHFKRQTGAFSFPQDFAFKTMVVFGLVSISTIIVSYNSEETLQNSIDYLKLIVFYLIIFYTIRHKWQWELFLGLFVFLVAREAALSASDYYGGGAIYRMGIWRAQGRTSFGGDPNSLAATLAMTLPFVLAFFKAYRHWIPRMVCAGTGALFLIMIVNTGSRAGLIATLVVIGMTIFFSRHKLMGGIAALILILIGITVLPEQYRQRYLTLLSDEDVSTVSSGRTDIWKNGLNMFVANPVLGVGAGAFLEANLSGDFGPPMEKQPHSLYIQLIATTGSVGAIVWLSFLFYIIFLMTRDPKDMNVVDPSRSPPEQHLNWVNTFRHAFLTSTVVMLFSGIFGHSLYRFNWYMNAALIATLYSIYRSTRTAVRNRTPGVSRYDEHKGGALFNEGGTGWQR